MNEFTKNDTDIVYVPVPRQLLPLIYETIAQAQKEAAGNTNKGPGILSKRNLVDLIIEVAGKIGADRRPVSLTELYEAYIQTNPGIGKGGTRGSFDATLNYHCINMRSRFPDIKDKKKSAYWLSKPAFKRVKRAYYMLLSTEEIAQFHRCVEVDSPLVYMDEYNVDDLFQVTL
ncbi:hypothetical protein [Ktedonobacter racemifer]|uniref:Uncharacterized protein n=1 Tax=Ktedonobacter racemifer DSM 44963 TaxID=485913 RepID=D6TH13_KTERA|nr:hypothetical protein [Ktedonobacter racemifer]EFH88942.1 hypothetical protein Krac_10458 [Ktedonobacter racemifer DSM 44963]